MSYKLLFFIFLLSKRLSAFQDSDIDGVEDRLDLCPDTPFDILVNRDGCPQDGEKKETQKDNYYGKLTLKIGADISRDENYEDSDAFNLYGNYSYHKWNFSISNSRSTTNSSYTEDNSNSDNDIYLSMGYRIPFSTNNLKLSLGTKIVNDATTTTKQGRGYGRHANNQEKSPKKSSKDNDYFLSLNLNHTLSPKQDIFLYYAYNLSGNSNEVEYENYSSFSIGTGYAINSSWYSGLSYNYTESIYQDSYAEQSLSWFNSYTFSKNYFATASYKYGLEELSYDHTLSFGVGVWFE